MVMLQEQNSGEVPGFPSEICQKQWEILHKWEEGSDQSFPELIALWVWQEVMFTWML